MESKLAVILFIEFERVSMSSLLDLITSKGGTRLWSEGNRFTFQFRSPTDAIVAGECVLTQFPKLDGEDRVRCYIDICEVSFADSVPVGRALSFGWSLLSRANSQAFRTSDFIASRGMA
jgi:hypothetical protein